MIAKSTVIKDRGGKSGGRAVKAVGLTSGGLRCVSHSGLRPPQGGLTATQKSAEGIGGGKRRPLAAGTRRIVYGPQYSGIAEPVTFLRQT